MMEQKLDNGICVIIPAYNEAKVINSVLDSLPRSIKFSNKQVPLQVLVVNDGSTDNTANIIKQRADVILIDHMLNSGAGGATRTGFRYARENGFNYAITMDADGQHHPKDVVKLAKEILKERADFIIGSRLINKQGMVWYRVIGNYGLNIITFLLFGVWVTDSQSGLKAMNNTALEKMNFNSRSYAFCSEMVWIAHKHGFKIAELPIKAIYSNYSLAKGQSNWNGFPLVRELIKRRLMGLIDG